MRLMATLFGKDTAGDAWLIALYERIGRTLDDLPYTQEFEQLHAAATALTPTSKADLFHRLHNLRKAGKLPRLGRAAAGPPRIEPEQEQMLVSLVEEAVGRLSLRDRLLYTPPFDQLVEQFNAEAGLALSHHDVWRIIAKLAK